MTEQLFLLRDEFYHFTGLRTPRELRNKCYEAMQSISAHSLPISSIDHPVIICLTSLFGNYEKQSKYFITPVCECIIYHCFSKRALSSVTSSLLIRIDSIDWKTVHQLTDFLQTSILENFPDIDVIQSYFSIILQLMANNDSNISSVSYAAFQSMMSFLIETIIKAEKKVPIEFLAICKDLFGMNESLFENPLYFILFLIFNDLSLISLNQKLQFLTCQKVPSNLIFDVLEMLLTEYTEVFTNCTQLGSVFESNVIQSMDDKKSLPFIVAFIKSCYLSHYSLCYSIFTEYLDKWKRDKFSSLFLFNSIFLSKAQIIHFILENSDFDGLTIFLPLIQNIHDMIDFHHELDKPIQFSLKPKSFSRVVNEITFVLTSPFEIIFQLINSIAMYEPSSSGMVQSKIEHLFRNASDNLIELYFFALKFSTNESFDIVCKSFVYLLRESQRKFDDFEQLVNFDVLCDSQNLKNRDLFYINEKKSKWDRVLSKIATYSPSICEGNWSLFFASLFAVSENDVDLSPSFAIKFSDDVAKEVLTSLIDIRPFPHTFINDFLITNIDRFEVLWPILDNFFDHEIGRNDKIDDKIFELFIDLIQKAFVSKTEFQLLELGAKIMKSTKSVSTEKKVIVLKELRDVFGKNFQALQTGFPFLFEILDPMIYDKEILSADFSLFTVICTDYIHAADPVFIRPCLELVFKFAQQTEDINISLSSFDLIWNLVKSMEKNDDNWMHFLFKLSDMFYDERLDVAQCSIRTFFTYLASNFSIISKKTVDYFLTKGFKTIIDKFDCTKQNSNIILQPILYEICHFFATFWTQLFSESNNSHFDIYIQKNEDLILKCELNDTILAAFPFYECIYTSNVVLYSDCSNELNLHSIILKSLTKMADEKFVKIENINSILLSQFGRTIGTIMKSFKNHLDQVPFTDYIAFLKHIFETFQNQNFVHITTQRIVDSIITMFPIPDFYADIIFNLFLEEYQINDDKFKKLICSECVDLFQVYSDKKFIIDKFHEQLFSPHGEKFAKAILKADVEWGDMPKHELVELFTKIKNSYSKLEETAILRINELSD